MEKEDFVDIPIRNLFSTTKELVNLREMHMLLHDKLNALHLDISRENFFGEKDSKSSLTSFIEEYPFLYQMQQQLERESIKDAVVTYKKERRKIKRFQVAFSIELFVLLSTLVFYFSQTIQETYSNGASEVEIEESQMGR